MWYIQQGIPGRVDVPLRCISTVLLTTAKRLVAWAACLTHVFATVHRLKALP